MVEPRFFQEIIEEIRGLPEDVGADKIGATEGELAGLHYAPLLTLEVPSFLTAEKSDILAFVEGISPEKRGTLQKEDLSLIVYHYKLLQRLRRSDPESWDHVMALMDDD